MFKRFKVTSLFPLVCLLAFELISYNSTRNGLFMLFGIASWARLLAFSFVAVDFAGAGLLFFAPDDIEESYGSMFAGWILTVIGDVGLGYLTYASSIVLRADTHILVQTGVVSRGFFATGIPLIIALLIAGMQIALVHSLNMTVAELMDVKVLGKKNKPKNDTFKPVTYFKEPDGNNYKPNKPSKKAGGRLDVRSIMMNDGRD